MLALNEIKVYRINDQVVWTEGQGIDKLEALINRPLPTRLVKADTCSQAAITEADIGDVTPAPASRRNTQRFPTGTGTKKDSAIAIYSEMVVVAGTTKRMIIDRFIAELSMTEAGAMTYYYTARSAVAQA